MVDGVTLRVAVVFVGIALIVRGGLLIGQATSLREARSRGLSDV